MQAVLQTLSLYTATFDFAVTESKHLHILGKYTKCVIYLERQLLIL